MYRSWQGGALWLAFRLFAYCDIILKRGGKNMAKKGDKTKRKGKEKGIGGRRDYWIEMDMPNKLDAIEGWAREGAIEREMYTALGVSESTWFKWKREKPEFAAALKRGKFESNGEILNSAFKQTTGYYQRVTEPMKLRDEFGAEHVKLVTYDKFIPANSTLTIFMMKNRMPEQYRDKQEIKHEGQMGVTIVDDIGSDE